MVHLGIHPCLGPVTDQLSISECCICIHSRYISMLLKLIGKCVLKKMLNNLGGP